MRSDLDSKTDHPLWRRGASGVYDIVYNLRVLTLSEAAAQLGIQAATLRRQIHRKKLRARKRRLGGYEVWVVSEAEVERYARENKK